MRPPLHQPQRGSVVLVSLCFVAVIAIALGSYIAVCSRTMTLSGRAVQSGLSKQLAEMGLEEALRAFNKNQLSGTDATAALADWSANGVTVDWSLDTTNKRATANITFSSPATKFGAAVSNASVKIRVDNYDAAALPATWSASANYRPGNLAGYTDGIWYRCTAYNAGRAPMTTTSNNMYWMPEQSQVLESMTWVSGTDYILGDMVLRNGSWYRCKTAHTAGSSSQPPNTSYWVAVPYVSADSNLYYTNESILNYYGYWYRYNSGWDGYLPYGSGTWTVTWFWDASTPTAYIVGDVVWYNNRWYRCKTAHTSSGSFNSSYWDTASSLATSAASAWAWNSNYNYNPGDTAYYSSRWYRCVVANLGQAPSTTSAYWSASPLLSQGWDTHRQYGVNDIVYYNGIWYRGQWGTNIYGQNPVTSSGYWTSAADTSYRWNATTNYSAGTYRVYGDVWYKCLASNTGKSPNNTAYWTATWANASGVTTGAPVAYAESTVTLGDNTTSKTQLRATLVPAPLFPNAVGASTTIEIRGGGTIDSYDSTRGTYASQVGTATNYSAVLAATNTTSANPAISIFGTDVKGYVAAPASSTSPYAPLFSSGGTVKGPSSADAIDLSRVSRSPYVPQFDCQPGPTSSQPARNLSSAFSSWDFHYGTALTTNPGGSVTIGTPGAITPAHYYYNGTLDAASSTSYELATLNIVGPVILYINGHLHTRSGGTIIIAETGSAEIHIDGGLKIEAASNGIINTTLDPKKLVILSDTTSSTSQYYGATASPFYGVIYAPKTTTSLGLEIQSGVTLYGAISAKKITFTADANVHYDTSLRYATIPGVDQPYAIAQWRELTDASELATMP